MATGIGGRFQEETKYVRGKLGSGFHLRRVRPEPVKTYPDASKISLKTPDLTEGPPLWETIRERRSLRSFARDPVDVSEVSEMLWAAQGITRFEMGWGFRTAPSAGALYPVETYLSSQNVTGLEPGVYHYSPRGQELELLKQGHFGTRLAEAALDQDFIARAGVVFCWTAVFARAAWKYAERAYRYVYLDAGHIAQNVALAAVALGLGSCQVAALYDDEVNSLLGVDGAEESVIYLTAVGHPL